MRTDFGKKSNWCKATEGSELYGAIPRVKNQHIDNGNTGVFLFCYTCPHQDPTNSNFLGTPQEDYF